MTTPCSSFCKCWAHYHCNIHSEWPLMDIFLSFAKGEGNMNDSAESEWMSSLKIARPAESLKRATPSSYLIYQRRIQKLEKQEYIIQKNWEVQKITILDLCIFRILLCSFLWIIEEKSRPPGSTPVYGKKCSPHRQIRFRRKDLEYTLWKINFSEC